MKKYSVWLIVVSLLISAGCCRQGLGTVKPFKLKLFELSANQEKYADKLIEVKGELNNSGTNYFTDLKITLGDGQGNSIRVQPWLPISVPPPRPGGPRNRPALISDYLGKKLRLLGKWVRQDEGFILQVEQAEQAE
ncbi:hypothetical protein HY768_01065 [candidate division TA06 bacterium]|uniref:Uncharacterized protein n=1 Tax=candidate division TA06 bacterium TaxID=2250710 RepID=A0A933MJY6_UNCT6|nr:hypothetical protein [candidate division TA06 bacterium]